MLTSPWEKQLDNIFLDAYEYNATKKIVKNTFFDFWLQWNPAITDPPPTEFRLEQMQIHAPFIVIPFISFVGNRLLSYCQ